MIIIAQILATEALEVVALASSFITIVVVKGLDYFFRKKGMIDDATLKEGTTIRQELREEVRVLKDDFRELVVANDNLRNDLFELRAHCNSLQLRCDTVKVESRMYKALAGQFRSNISDLSGLLGEGGQSQVSVALRLEQILEEVILIEDIDNSDDGP